MQDALRPVDERGHVPGHLVADDASGERRRLGAAHLGDATVLDSDAETARIRAVEGADAGAFYDRHWGTLLATGHYAGIGHPAVPIASADARPSRMSKGGKSGIP